LLIDPVHGDVVFKLEGQGMLNTVSHRKEKNVYKQDVAEKKPARKPKKNARGIKVPKKKDKDKDKPQPEQKVDFPEPLVKAHQAAYAFLNPSINKYDVVLGLLEQATQTQVSVQPMVAFMALRYEEIIQGLEEMADEGEKVLKENGEHLAWPSQMKNLSSTALKSVSFNTEPPPDLLQQLLQYTTQRMRNVSQTVGGIGNSALEEAVAYFASVSELLEEKLKVKQVLETRLMQLLSRIEMASLRKPGPEDSALFSEDSGIGAESESLAGSERQHRRESCESTRTNSTTVSPMAYKSKNTRQGVSRQRLVNSLLGSVSLDEGDYDNDDEEEEMDRRRRVVQVGFIKRSNSSPVDCDLRPHRLPPKRIENPQSVAMTLKMKNAISGRIQFVPTQNSSWMDEEERSSWMPQTAAPIQKAVVKKNPMAKERRSWSAESIRNKGEDPMLLELDRTQKDLNQRLQRISKNKASGITRTAHKQNQITSPAQSSAINRKNPSLDKNSSPQALKGRVGLTKHNSKKQPVTSSVTEDKSGRNSVKKLIDTFSQGIEGLDNPEVLGPLKGVRKCGVPVLPGLGNVEAVLSTGITSCRPESSSSEKPDYLDLDSLPPPPLEVLMDNSFERAQRLSTSVTNDGATQVRKSPVCKRVTVSQRLRSSVQSVTVLPSKTGVPQASKSLSLTRVDLKDTSMQSNISSSDVQSEVKPGEEKNNLNQQAIHIIQLSRSSDSERSTTSNEAINPSPSQDESADAKDGENGSVPGLNTTASIVTPVSLVSNQPPATPPMSRGRLLPSTPSTPSTLHQRLPSPHNFKRQPSPTSSASPPVNRKLPTPAAAQRRLPSPPVAKQNILKCNSASPYPFKAPSPPASPKVQRWSRESSSEDSSSTRMISNARSVFCPASSSLFEAQPCPVPRPPQAWTSTGVSVLSRPWGSRGRFPVSIQGPRPFIRRCNSDRRPSLNLTSRSPGMSEPSRDDGIWGSQSDLKATPRSASHPDLYVVGQALHRD
uniref:Photoreceptor cilium actin regulator n=1 Tax=Mola mola TaxID=94237 RepID=A0A3Q4AP33_MOLML